MSLVIWCLAIIVGFLLIYLSVELLFGLRRSVEARHEDGAPPRITILIPAHNEESVIASTVASLKDSLCVGSQIVVVADNCSDSTAALAQSAGATVVTRNDLKARGKGYALAFGRDFLTAMPPDVVIVLDADCRLAEGSELWLAHSVMSTGEVAQASNLLTAAAAASPLVQISNFAMLVKNTVRARGLERLGGGGLLFGTGMAFPWTVFSNAPLATANVVEDMQLALQLARSGTRVHLVEDARVVSAAAALVDSTGQRRRWEHGFLQTARNNAMPLLMASLRHKSANLLTLGLHLLVPPLALTFAIAGGALLLAISARFWIGTWLPAIIVGAALLCASTLLLAAWVREGRTTLSGRALLSIPVYMLWKAPIYLSFFVSRQASWNRTRRARGDDTATN